MACEILNCCRFFDEKMRDLPKTTAYIKQRMCLDDYRSCSRFRIFNNCYTMESLPGNLVEQPIYKSNYVYN